MLSKVMIKGIAVYHPDDCVSNEKYFKHFEKQGKDIRHLYEDVYGREYRYEIHNEGKPKEEQENTLTMEIKVAKKLLKQLNMSGDEVDGLIIANQIPEYFVPNDGILVHHAIGANKNCFTYDVNCNCEAMVMSMLNGMFFLDNSPKMRNILVVGGDYLTQSHDPDNEMFYGCFGDAACAIMLTKTEETRLLDYEFFTQLDEPRNILYPGCGFSNIPKGVDTLTVSSPVSVDLELTVQRFKDILERNNLTIDDIGGCCFGQFVKKNLAYVKEQLGIRDGIMPFVGDRYGYTGVSSPYLAFNELVEKNVIKRGDYLLVWTHGAGIQHVISLIQY